SGEEAGVLSVSAAFAAKGTRTHRLNVSHAFHSALMDPMLKAFDRVAADVSYRPARIAVVSNVSGKLAEGELSTAAYWVRHVREGVRFADGVAALHASGVSKYLELGPKGTLLGLVPACLPQTAERMLAASLREDRAEPLAVLEALGSHYAQGGRVEWKGGFPNNGRQVGVPTYGWQRRGGWIEGTAAGPRRGASGDPPPGRGLFGGAGAGR